MYNIADRDDGHEEADESSGSESYPSRTAFGAACSLGKEHPELTAPAVFFGFWRVNMWNYYWGMSSAQIELAIADGPVIVYKHDKKDKSKKPTAAAIEKAALLWEQEHKEDGGKLKLNMKNFIVN